MMATKRSLLKALAITAFSLTFATTLSFGLANTFADPQTANAYEITFDSADALASKYAHGATLKVPMGTIEGVKATSYMVIAPSGYAYDSEKITLSEAGPYTIRWFAEVGGKEVSAEKTVLVEKGVFSGEGGAVTCEYKEDLEHAQKNGYETGKFTRETYTTDGDGIYITLEDGAKFTYNNVIDLRNFSNEPFISIHPYECISNIWTASRGAECEYRENAKSYYVTLTDCYDPSNYVTIELRRVGTTYYADFHAGAAGQVPHTLVAASNGKYKIDGESYDISFSPATVSANALLSQLGWKLYYDTNTQRVYVDYANFVASQNNGTWYKRVLLADLANTAIYPDNAFKGFSTGEVYLSLTADKLVENKAKIDITSLGGRTGKDMLTTVEDTTAPTIQEHEKLADMKKIALNEEISIPKALSLDTNSVTGINANMAVYYNYDAKSATNALVGIVNGKFTPKKVGTYTIVYTAADYNGNKTTKTVDLICEDVANDKAVVLTPTSVEHEAGVYVDVPGCSISGLYTDEANLKLYYTNEKGEQVLYKDSQVFLDRLGEFKFTYVYETPFKTYTATTSVTSLATDKVIMGNPVLPKYFIKNAKYTLDPVVAYEYTEESTRAVLTKMYMKADGGEYVEVNPQEVAINANSTVQFKYTYGAGVLESEPVTVLDVGFGGALSAKDYFYSADGGITTVATKSHLQLISNGTVKNTTVEYINPLSMSSFDFEFNFPSKDKEGTTTYATPENIVFTFTDYYDRSKVATFKIRPARAGMYIDINGVERVGQIPGRKFFDINTYFSYSNGVIKFEGAEYDLGNVLTSDRVIFSITINGVANVQSCMNVTLLCDNVLTSAKYDTATPKIGITKMNMGYHKFGTVITVSKANASDLICPYLESGLKVMVMMPDGSFAKSEDGVTLDGTNPVDREYQVKLSQVGVYSVLYSYTDQNGDFESFTYSPIVKDEQAPTIVVDGKVEDEVLTAKWGASVTVATYSVSDDITATDKITTCISVIYPSAVLRIIPNGGTFYAEEKGRYTVIYYAQDEVGNYTMFVYYVQVS